MKRTWWFHWLHYVIHCTNRALLNPQYVMNPILLAHYDWCQVSLNHVNFWIDFVLSLWHGFRGDPMFSIFVVTRKLNSFDNLVFEVWKQNGKLFFTCKNSIGISLTFPLDTIKRSNFWLIGPSANEPASNADMLWLSTVKAVSLPRICFRNGGFFSK